MRGDNLVLAKFVGVSPALISLRLTDKRRVSWDIAKRLASATQTEPVIWMESSGEEIRQRIDEMAEAGFGVLAQRRLEKKEKSAASQQ